MKIARKILLWALGAVAGLIGLAVTLFFIAPSGLISGPVDNFGQERLGRSLSFSGAVERRLYPTLGADFTDVTIANAPGAGPEPLLRVDRVSVDFDPAAALRGEIRALRVTFIRPTLQATINEAGESNWRLGPPRPAPQNALEEIAEAERVAREIGEELTRRAADHALAPELPQVTRIADGRIRFEDRRNGRGALLTAFNMTVSKDEAGALALEGTSNFNGRPTSLVARLPDPFALIEGRADAASFTYEGDGARLSFDGAFDLRRDSLRAAGEVTARLSGDTQKTAWLRQGLPRALDPLGEVLIDGTLDADRSKLELALKTRADYNGRPLDGTLSAAGGPDWRRGKPIRTFLNLSARGLAKAEASGTLVLENDSLKTFDGGLSASSQNWSEVRLWSGVTPPRRPIGPIRLESALKAESARFELTEAMLQVEDAQARATLSVDWSGEKLQLSGALRDGPLDLYAFAPGRPGTAIRRLAASDGTEVEPNGGGASAPDPEAPLAGEGEVAKLSEDDAWSTNPLPLSVLEQAEGLFTVDLKGASFGDVDLGATDVDLTLGDGGVALDVTEIALYGGKLSGTARLAKAGEAARFKTALVLSEVQTQPFLAALGREDWLRGPLDARLSAEGEGASMALLMGSLEGRGSAEMRDGAVLAINFAAASLDRRLALFGARQAEAGVTPFTRARLPFTIEKGVAKTDSFRVEGDVVRAKGEGVVDIGRRSVDLTVTPTGFGAISFLGIDAVIARAFPVRMLGPWSAARVFLDRGRGADTRVDREGN